jgi:DNA-binding protein HU-beta
MNKNELIKAMSEKLSERDPGIFPFKVIDNFLDSMTEVIAGELENKGKVTLMGFGTFAVAHRKEKVGINPRTKEKIKIKAKDVPVFKPGKELKEKVK